MKNKKLAMVFGMILLIGMISALETSYCCEKTSSGAICQNMPASQCDTGTNPDTGQPYKAVPTSCEATSYCRLGCCNLFQQGECMQNTPQAVCEESGISHFIADNPSCDVPQCELGCCLMGDQAAFVTEIKCNKLSALYGLQINFRTDITNELDCLSSATSEKKGACVFEKDLTRTCKATTQLECNEMEANEENQNVKFYMDHLCSDPELGAGCAPSKSTTCVEGRDEVYFLDTCGNVANIYDSEEADNIEYWKLIKTKAESCNPDDIKGNANSETCGNCNYILGSVCKKYTKSDENAGAKSPTYGDNICRDLSCWYDNNGDGTKENYLHGETWCAHAIQDPNNKGDVLKLGISPIVVEGNEASDNFGFILGMGVKDNDWTREHNPNEDEPGLDVSNLPGSRYFRMLCYNGEVMVEPCADYRQEVCVESQSFNAQVASEMQKITPREAGYSGYRNAACRVNRWQDCFQQQSEQDCINIDKRDCRWLKGKYEKSGDEAYVCVPLYAPGFKFWGEEDETTVENPASATGTEEGNVPNSALQICQMASDSCKVTFEVNLKDEDKFGLAIGIDNPGENLIKSGRGCYDNKWQQARTQYALSLGDCGQKTNYLGEEGSSHWTSKRDNRGKWN